MNDFPQPKQEPADAHPPAVAPPATHAEWVGAAAALERLRCALVEAATAANLQWLQLDYEGFADEGSPTSPHCEPPIDLDDLRTDAPAFLPRWEPEGGVLYEAASMPRSVATVLDEMLDLGLCITGHAGFENGGGGHGQLLLEVASGVLTLDHHDHVVHSENSFHTFSPGGAAAVPAAATRQAISQEADDEA